MRDRLEKAGVGFVSIGEHTDIPTPMGCALLSTMGSRARFCSDNLGAESTNGERERESQELCDPNLRR